MAVPSGSCLSRQPQNVFSRWWHRFAKERFNHVNPEEVRAGPSYLEGRLISDNRRQTRIGYFNPSEESQEQLVGFRVDRIVTGGQGS